MELLERRVALRLSLLAKHKTGLGELYRDRGEDWEKELAIVNARLDELGLLKQEEGEGTETEVGEAEPGDVVTLRGRNFHMEAEATEGSASRPECSFCHGSGERTVDMDIDGFVYEVLIDCPH